MSEILLLCFKSYPLFLPGLWALADSVPCKARCCLYLRASNSCAREVVETEAIRASGLIVVSHETRGHCTSLRSLDAKPTYVNMLFSI